MTAKFEERDGGKEMGSNLKGVLPKSLFSEER